MSEVGRSAVFLLQLQKYRFDEEYDFLLPKSRAEVRVDVDSLPDNVHSCRVQVLRSASSWSSGLSPNTAPEHSIEEAYYDVILAAKHYIYIEVSWQHWVGSFTK